MKLKFIKESPIQLYVCISTASCIFATKPITTYFILLNFDTLQVLVFISPSVWFDTFAFMDVVILEYGLNKNDKYNIFLIYMKKEFNQVYKNLSYVNKIIK